MSIGYFKGNVIYYFKVEEDCSLSLCSALKSRNISAQCFVLLFPVVVHFLLIVLKAISRSNSWTMRRIHKNH